MGHGVGRRAIIDRVGRLRGVQAVTHRPGPFAVSIERGYNGRKFAARRQLRSILAFLFGREGRE